MLFSRLSSASIISVAVALTGSALLAVPADVGRTADIYANAVRYSSVTNNVPQEQTANADAGEEFKASNSVGQQAAFAVSPVARSFEIIDHAGAVETEAFKVSLAPSPLSEAAINDALEQEVLKVALDAPHPAIAQRMLAHEDRAFSTDIAPQVLTAAAINNALEQEVLKIALDGPHPVIAQRMLAHEDRAFETDLTAEILSASAIENAVEQEVFKVALDAPVVAAPVGMLAQGNDAIDREATTLATSAIDEEVPSSDLVPASANEVEAPQGTAASSRQHTGSGDLMADMAAADSNLVMREGGANGVDTMMMSSDVLFAFGSATLAEDALETLAMIGKMSSDVPVIEVFGHTDAIGSESSNRELGRLRAEAVRAWLLQNTEFTPQRVIATGIGEVDPVAPNTLANGGDNPNGRAQNRRVEFAFHAAAFDTD